MRFVGVVLILLGLAAFGVMFWANAPIEEPASLGKTPNPSLWNEERFNREIRYAVWLSWFVRYGAIPTGLLFIGAGIWCLFPVRRDPTASGLP